VFNEILCIDFGAAISAIQSQTFSNDFEMQQAVCDAFIVLKDPHTMYYKPSTCYNLAMIQPFQFNGDFDMFGIQVLLIFNKNSV
jgi:hypothetical protein